MKISFRQSRDSECWFTGTKILWSPEFRLHEANLIYISKLIWLVSGLVVAKPDWLTYDDEKHSVQAVVVKIYIPQIKYFDINFDIIFKGKFSDFF